MTGMPSRRHQAVIFLAGVAVCAVIAALLIGVAAIRSTQLGGTPLGKKLLAQADQIQSCTTPGGACYQRGQRQTAAVVGDISLRQIAAVACADAPGTQSPAEIKACVDRTLRVYAATRKP